MTLLKGDLPTSGYHWETGTVHNYYAYRGARAPYTGQPYSEALLLGISGGIVMGYFTFAYEGYDPQCNILTRNTFAPLDRLLSRLGAVQHLEQTAIPARAEAALLDALADGTPAIVWADLWSLPYNGMTLDPTMWGTAPILVYGFDQTSGTVTVADRSSRVLTLPAEALARARGRIKKDKHRLLTLDQPDPDKLTRAVEQGIHNCINLFTEKPPKGAAHNFGLKAYRHWAEALSARKGRASWSTLFPAGIPLFAGLTFAFRMAFTYGKNLDGDAERSVYAGFLDEAAGILGKPALAEAAALFRASAAAWRELRTVMLPDRIPPFARARELIWERHERFMREGNGALARMVAIDAELADIRQSMERNFPLTEAETMALREEIAAQVMRVHDLEAKAVACMTEA